MLCCKGFELFSRWVPLILFKMIFRRILYARKICLESRIIWIRKPSYNSAFMNLIARLILNTKCEIAVFTSVMRDGSLTLGLFCMTVWLFCMTKPNIVHLVALKNQDILNDDALHFKLAWSVLKIASFEFASLQYFNSTFMNLKIARLVLNVKCEVVMFTQCSRQWLCYDKQNIVHLVAYIHMLTSINEKIFKTEKTNL